MKKKIIKNKFKINQFVTCKPKTPVPGYLGGHEFTARIEEITSNGTYIVVDQECDTFEMMEDELEFVD